MIGGHRPSPFSMICEQQARTVATEPDTHTGTATVCYPLTKIMPPPTGTGKKPLVTKSAIDINEQF
jgi:hypothetical protein